MKRIAITAALAMVLLTTTSPALWAGKRYEVRGTATVAAMPDVAEFTVPLSASINGWAEPPRVKSWELIQEFRRAVPFDVSLNECTNQRYSCFPTIKVRVSDFSVLPPLARIATESEYKGWTIFYDVGDTYGLGRSARDAALADAKEKAVREARRLGRKTVTLKDTGKAHICSLLLHDEPGDCYTEGDEPTEVVVVTAWRRDFVRTSFDVPASEPKKMTAAVDAVFELR